uniref:Plasminogen activator inhibitor 1 RNA-binding protein n=1 Tax=Lygus hesperus TaxID=30085 RepID=A0A146LYP5_LYGHE
MSSTQYGIGVTKNRFELFDSGDEDPLEVLKIQEQEREAKKKTKLSEKENKGKEPAVKAKSTTVRKGIKETQNLKPQDAQKAKEDTKTRVPRVDRGGERKFPPEIREDRNNRKNKEERPPSDFQREDRGERVDRKEFKVDRAAPVYGGDSVIDSRGRGRGARGGFAPRGARGGARGGPRPGFDARGKREYDRQSGSDKTGVKPVDKREGTGAHNWGNHRDDLEDMNNQSTQPPEDNTWTPEKVETEAVAPEPSSTVADTEEGTPNALEEEKKELTLDEWKALKAPRQKPTYNLRKAGEGEDLSQWKKMYALQKKKDGEDDDDDEEYEYENCEYPQRVGRQKHVLDIDIHFKDTRGAGRGRGGRGAGRGGPRMPMRGNNPNPPQEKFSHQARGDPSQKLAPKVDDEHDFPSLG